MSDHLIGLILDDKYELETVLGTGGMGLVFRATDHALKRPVAIKIIQPNHTTKPKLTAAFIREAYTIASLEHPYILRVYDFGTQTPGDQDLLYLVMSYAPGGTLAEQLQIRTFSVDEADRVLRQICEALHYAHTHHVIHLDLKPLNILFDAQGNVQVADFGIAKLLEDTGRVKVETGLGTRNYMPPEQLLGGEVGPFSDVYAIGMMLHEMLTGKPPARSYSDNGLVLLEIDPSIPKPIQRVIERAGHSNPEERYRTAGNLYEDFAATVSGQESRPLAIRQQREEARRMDAAMPSRTVVDQPTELWVQICLPGSAGFRDELPQSTPSGDVITRQDVQTGKLTISFPLNPTTGQPEPIRVTVDVRAPDFRIEESQQTIMLFSSRDSGKLLFSLTPAQARKRSAVHVTVRQTLPDGSSVTIGAVALATHIAPTGVKLAAHLAWSLVSLPLSAVTFRRSAEIIDEPPETVHFQDSVVNESISENTTLQNGLSNLQPKPRRAPIRNRRMVNGVVAVAVVALIGILAAALTAKNDSSGGSLFGSAANAPQSRSATQEARPLPSPPQTISDCQGGALAFNTNGTQLVCQAADRTIQIVDIETASVLHSLPDAAPMTRAWVLADGRVLLWSQNTNQTIWWDPQTGTQEAITAAQSGSIHEEAYSPDGTLIAVAGEDRSISVFDLESGALIAAIPEQADLLTFSADGNTLASARQDSPVIHLWDPRTGAERDRLETDISGLTALALNLTGDVVAIGTSNGTVRLWNAAAHTFIGEWHIQGIVEGITFSPAGTLLAVGGPENVTLWPVR